MYNINKKTNLQEYPITAEKVEFYKKDNNGKEIYISHKNAEIYAFDFPGKEEIYAKDTNIKYYINNENKEIYAVDLKKDLEKFINISNEDKYCQNKKGREFYPLDFIGKNKVAKNQSGYFYAKDENDNFYYPVDEFGNEFSVKNDKEDYLIIVSKNGFPIAPKNRNGTVNYIKNQYGEVPYKCNKQGETSLECDSMYFIGLDGAGVGQYPRRINKNEYYPDNHFSPKFTTDAYGNLKYALSNDGKIIYPLIFGIEETYINDKNLDSYTILLKNINYFTRYINIKGKDVYPIKKNKNGLSTEMIINNLYAKNGSKMFYPKDSLKNEYINSDGNLLDSYPLTSDNQIIIPNFKNEPLLKQEDSHLSKQIKCLLYRPEFKRYDFLLNCSSNKYEILHSKSFSSINSFRYIIIFLSLISLILFFILIK